MTPQEERRKRLEAAAHETWDTSTEGDLWTEATVVEAFVSLLEREIDAAVEQERESAGTVPPSSTRLMFCHLCGANFEEAHGFMFRRVCTGGCRSRSESPAAKGLAELFDAHLEQFPPEEQERRVKAAMKLKPKSDAT